MKVTDYFYQYLSQEMDADLVAQQMHSLNLLNQNELNTTMVAINKYQKNCLILEKVRIMDVDSLTTFCKMLESYDHQKHLGIALFKGKKFKLSIDIC